MTERSDVENQPDPKFRFSLKILMIGITCVAVLFGLQRLMWPWWPRSIHRWMLPGFLVWTTSVAGFGLTRSWIKRRQQDYAIIPKEGSLEDHLNKACLWSAIPILFWIGFVAILAKQDSYFSWQLHCLAAAHLFPATLVGCARTLRAFRLRQGRAVMLLWLTSTGTSLPPVLAAVIFLFRSI